MKKLNNQPSLEKNELEIVESLWRESPWKLTDRKAVRGGHLCIPLRVGWEYVPPEGFQPICAASFEERGVKA